MVKEGILEDIISEDITHGVCYQGTVRCYPIGVCPTTALCKPWVKRNVLRGQPQRGRCGSCISTLSEWTCGRTIGNVAIGLSTPMLLLLDLGPIGGAVSDRQGPP